MKKWKSLSRKQVVEILSVIGMISTGFFLFFNLILIVPLALILAGAITFYHGGSTEILLHFSNFVKVWFSIVGVFLVSALVFVINKYFVRKKR